MVKLSIITINYNNAEGLRKTLASVASQTYADIEHVIVDVWFRRDYPRVCLRQWRSRWWQSDMSDRSDKSDESVPPNPLAQRTRQRHLQRDEQGNSYGDG